MEVRVANTWWSRFRGLIGDRDPRPLLIPRCASVHTFFMHARIEIRFLDAEERVLRVVERAKPWRFYFGPRGTVSVLEVPLVR
ncbi:MAG: DUF192 domain-containing protein [Acidobacteria bacterium]|nr:DUF192 domain-containing protein [Acidobacteriota bacterium]